MGPLLKDDALVRTRRTWLFACIVLAVAGLPPLIFAVFHAIAGHPVSWAAFPGPYGALFGLVRAWNRWWREDRGRVRADETGLWLGERCVIPRASIRHGYVLEREGQWYVRLGRMLRLVDVEVTDKAAGEALLTAMRLDAAHSVAEYPMTNGTFRGSFVRAGLFVVPLVLAPVVVHLSSRSLATFALAMLAATTK